MPPNRPTASPRRRLSAVGSPSGEARVPTLLVLQLDSEKLRQQGLSFAQLATKVTIPSRVLGARVKVVEATTVADLHEQLFRLGQEGQTFDTVAIIAHSNATGIRIASDKGVHWSAFAAYLQPFKPERLVLVACKAGRSSAAALLFENIPALKRIYACPTNASAPQAALMVALLPVLLAVKDVSREAIQGMQVGMALLTGGQVREWTRGDMNSPEEGRALDLVSEHIDATLRRISQVVRSVT